MDGVENGECQGPVTAAAATAGTTSKVAVINFQRPAPSGGGSLDVGKTCASWVSRSEGAFVWIWCTDWVECR